MNDKDLRMELAVGRIWESATATVVGGVILWSVTSLMSQPALTIERTAPVLTTERTAVAATPAVEPTAARISPSAPRQRQAKSLDRECSRTCRSQLPLPDRRPPRRLRKEALSYAVPAGTILLYENFSHYREGDAAGWGPDTFIKTGLDGRNWLVSNVDGTHPVGCRMRLPSEFRFECRYSAYTPEVTRGIFGLLKEPVSTTISFLNGQGVKHAIQWVIKYGNDTTRLNPLGSSSLYAKKCYHTITLPDGTANEIGVVQPTGVLRIDRDNNVVKVFLDDQAAVVGAMGPMGQLVGFELDVVKAKNGTLSFTDFRIAR